MLRTKTTTAILPGTHAQQWGAKKVTLPVIPTSQQTTQTTTWMTKPTKNEQRHMLPHLGTSPHTKSIWSSTMSSPTLYASDSPITPHSECWDNVNLPMISPGSASTSAWMVQHNNSQEKSRLPTSTTQTWRNSSTIWNGTYAQRTQLTHSMKAVALQYPIPLYINKGLGSSGRCPTNGNDEVNNLDQQQWPSTYASTKKHLHSTYSSSKTVKAPRSLDSTTCTKLNL